MEGTCDGRVFDERELKFEIGDGESLGLPAGVEKGIIAMEQGEEALFDIKPKYDHMHHERKHFYEAFSLFFYVTVQLYSTLHCNTVLS